MLHFELFNEKNWIDFESRTLSDQNIFNIRKIYSNNFLHKNRSNKKIKIKIKAAYILLFTSVIKNYIYVSFYTFSIIMYKKGKLFI